MKSYSVAITKHYNADFTEEDIRLQFGRSVKITREVIEQMAEGMITDGKIGEYLTDHDIVATKVPVVPVRKVKKGCGSY